MTPPAGGAAAAERREESEQVWQPWPPAGEEGHTVAGVVKHAVVESPQLHNERDVWVYLPPGYAANPERRYPVVYMQDGQNLFDQATAFAGEWRIDESLEAAAPYGPAAIIVGVANLGPRRMDEYTPFWDHKHGGGDGRRYVEFLVATVKPLVDRSFRTLPEREHTGIAGSSLGGLISLYGFFFRRDVFGFCAALSPSIWFARRQILPFVRDTGYNAGRIYLDTGTAEGRRTLWNARRLRRILRRKGYDEGRNLLYVETHGARHEEAAWAERFPTALGFLLSGTPGPLV